MIKKIQKVNNVGSFLNFEWDKLNPSIKIDRAGNPVLDPQGHPKTIESSFGKFNILYGENGNGKSTFVKILKGLHFDDDHFLSRNWDKETGLREIEVLTDSSSIKFTDTTCWANNVLQNKFIFLDRDFVGEYVHSGHLGRTSQHDKKTGQLILYLGDFSSYKDQLDKLVSLKTEIQSRNNEIKEDYKRRSTGLSNQIEKPDEALSFSSSIVNDQKEKIQAKNEELKEEKKSLSAKLLVLKKSEDVLRLQRLNKIEAQLTIQPEEGQSLLSFSATSGTVEILTKIQGKESFISQGISLIKEKHLDDCPFCEQPIKNVDGNFIDLIKKYEAVFNDEFRLLQNNTRDRLNNYKKDLRLLLSNFYPPENGNLLGRFNRAFEENNEFPSFTLTSDEKLAIEKEIALANDKLEDLLKPSSTSHTSPLKDVFKKYDEFTSTYNNFIEEVNNTIVSQQDKIRTGEVQKEINEIEKRIAVIDAQTFSIAHLQEYKFIINQSASIKQNESVLANIDSILRALRDKVNAEFDTFITDYFATIKKNIRKIYPNLDIVEFEKSRGTSYDFRNNEINCGFIVKYKGHDRFKDLSEGEKQVIALAYFFAMLEKEQNVGDKIVVFDDPITSFDAGKRRQTAELIFDETKKCKQTFILTCDPLFRQYSQKIIQAQKSYYILKSASSSIFYTPKDVESVFNSFRKDLGEIHLAAGTDEDIVSYGQKLRFCIEEVRESYLGHNTDGLSEVLTKVKGANFGTLVPKIDDLLSIYGYCNVGGLAHFPKDGSTTWAELRNQVNKYLGLGI